MSKKKLCSSETSVRNKATLRNIPEDERLQVYDLTYLFLFSVRKGY